MHADLIQWRIYAALGGDEFSTLRPRQNGRHLTDGIFKVNLDENSISIQITKMMANFANADRRHFASTSQRSQVLWSLIDHLELKIK